jgi:hypothetical protein
LQSLLLKWLLDTTDDKRMPDSMMKSHDCLEKSLPTFEIASSN